MMNIAPQTTKRVLRKTPARQAGISSLQIVVALAVSALLLSGGTGAFKYVEHQKANNDMGELSDIRAGAVDFASKRNTKFTALSLDIGCKQQVFPSNRCTGTGTGTTVSNIWGGTIEIAAVDLNGGDDNGLRISSSGMSDVVCMKELSAQWDQWNQITVNTAAVKTTLTQVIDDSAINNACSAGTNTIHWTIRA